MPDVLLVLSDMQFDAMTYHSHDTSVEYIKKTFKDAGYKAPGIIYWNLAARETKGVPALANELDAKADEAAPAEDSTEGATVGYADALGGGAPAAQTTEAE